MGPEKWNYSNQVSVSFFVLPTLHWRFTNNPPSTSSEAPVTYFARSLARNTTGPAMSSGAIDEIKLLASLNMNRLEKKITPKSAKCCPVHHIVSFLLIRKVFFVDVGGNGARENCVCPDVVFSECHGTTLHQGEDASFCGGVMTEWSPFNRKLLISWGPLTIATLLRPRLIWMRFR